MSARWRSHVRSARHGGSCRLLYNSLRKHGTAAFELVVLVDGVNTREQLDALERLWIVALNATDTRVGYNMTFGGQGGVQTESVRKRIGLSGKGKTGGWNRGMKFGTYTDGRNDKISKSLRGRTLSDDHRASIGAGCKGKGRGENNPSCKLTDAQVKEMRLRHAGGEKQSSLSRVFDVHHQTVFRI